MKRACDAVYFGGLSLTLVVVTILTWLNWFGPSSFDKSFGLWLFIGTACLLFALFFFSSIFLVEMPDSSGLKNRWFCAFAGGVFAYYALQIFYDIYDNGVDAYKYFNFNVSDIQWFAAFFLAAFAIAHIVANIKSVFTMLRSGYVEYYLTLGAVVASVAAIPVSAFSNFWFCMLYSVAAALMIGGCVFSFIREGVPDVFDDFYD